MSPTTYINIFRTHLWDKPISEMAKAARDCTKSGAFLVLADESREELETEGFFKLAHSSDVSDLDLPSIPAGRVLWWNADYPLYRVWRRYPQFDYYIMVEYDAFLNCDIDDMIASCAQRGIDLVVTDPRQISAETHWSFPSVSEIGAPAWHALLPFTIFSKRMIEVMFEARRALARGLKVGATEQWPYCEAFIPTVAKMNGFDVADASEFTNAELLRFRPFLSVRDPRLRACPRIAHPVLSGARFVAAYVKAEPKGSHLLSDGYLRPELEREDPGDIASVLGKDARRFEPAKTAGPNESRVTDLARDKPATQCSWSPWSRGPTAEADARNANSGPLAEDYAFHTDGEAEPWWAVDLIQAAQVEAVEILNRRRWPSSFCRFKIETSLDGASWSVQFVKQDNRGISSAPERPALFSFAKPARARHVRIVKLDSGVLHLRRVRIFGSRT